MYWPLRSTRRSAEANMSDSPALEKAVRVVELPLRVRWSGPPKKYNLAGPLSGARPSDVGRLTCDGVGVPFLQWARYDEFHC